MNPIGNSQAKEPSHSLPLEPRSGNFPPRIVSGDMISISFFNGGSPPAE
jgi:hypothetical protein